MNDNWESRLLAQGVSAELIAAARNTGANMADVIDELPSATDGSLDPVQFFLILQALARRQRG